MVGGMNGSVRMSMPGVAVRPFVGEVGLPTAAPLPLAADPAGMAAVDFAHVVRTPTALAPIHPLSPFTTSTSRTVHLWPAVVLGAATLCGAPGALSARDQWMAPTVADTTPSALSTFFAELSPWGWLGVAAGSALFILVVYAFAHLLGEGDPETPVVWNHTRTVRPSNPAPAAPAARSHTVSQPVAPKGAPAVTNAPPSRSKKWKKEGPVTAAPRPPEKPDYGPTPKGSRKKKRGVGSHASRPQPKPPTPRAGPPAFAQCHAPAAPSPAPVDHSHASLRAAETELRFRAVHGMHAKDRWPPGDPVRRDRPSVPRHNLLGRVERLSPEVLAAAERARVEIPERPPEPVAAPDPVQDLIDSQALYSRVDRPRTARWQHHGARRFGSTSGDWTDYGRMSEPRPLSAGENGGRLRPGVRRGMDEGGAIVRSPVASRPATHPVRPTYSLRDDGDPAWHSTPEVRPAAASAHKSPTQLTSRDALFDRIRSAGGYLSRRFLMTLSRSGAYVLHLASNADTEPAVPAGETHIAEGNFAGKAKVWISRRSLYATFHVDPSSFSGSLATITEELTQLLSRLPGAITVSGIVRIGDRFEFLDVPADRF